MVEKRKNLVESRYFELYSQTFWESECRNHEIIIVKLNAYGFNLPVLRLVYGSLSNRRQRTRTEKPCSEYRLALVFKVTQEYILGPILSNIFLAYIFFGLKDVFKKDTKEY